MVSRLRTLFGLTAALALAATASAEVGLAWSSAGGKIVGEPALVSSHTVPGASFVLVARGTDDAMWWTASADGVTWRDWQSAGGELASAPSCIARTPGIVDCFARGTDNGVWQRSLVNGAWNDWSSLGGNLGGAPTAAALGSNAVVLLASSLNKMFTRGWVDGYGWGEWFKPWGDVTLSAKSSAGCDGWEGGIGEVDSTGVVNYPTSVFCVIRDGDKSFRQLADPDPNGDGQPFIGPMQGMEPTPFKPQLYVWKTKNGMLATITIVASNGGPMLQGKYLVGTGWTESFQDLGGGFTSAPTCGPKLCAGRGTDGAVWVAAR